MTSPAPKQRRSRETCDRILAATERLLRERLFEDLSVQDIAAEAGASVGSFYNLFGDKEALLPTLYTRHCEAMLVETDRMLDPDLWEGRSLADIVDALVERIVELHREQRGLLRALVLRSHVRVGAPANDRPDHMQRMLPRVGRLIASRSDEGDHPNPRRAGMVGFLMVLATTRERMLYPQTTAYAIRISETALKRELTRAWLCYLGVRG